MDVRDLRVLSDGQLHEAIRTLRRLIHPQPAVPTREHQDSLHCLACARLELQRRSIATRQAALHRFTSG